MKLVSYLDNQRYVPGIVTGELVVDAVDLARRPAAPSEVDCRSVKQIVASAGIAELQALDAAARDAADKIGRPLSELTLGPPIPDPEKVLGIGLNYASHVAEASPAESSGPKGDPVMFAMFATSLIGDGAAIELLRIAPDAVDWEGELAVVIGRTCKDVAEQDALKHVAGYMAFNDVSARDLQGMSPQWTLGKSFDTSGPCGPVLVTADEIPDPQTLTLTTALNGQIVQSASTSEMIRSVSELIAFLSATITLVPGDIIATGTPSGVGAGLRPMVFLKDGDTITVSISGIGELTNTVRHEQ